MIFTDNLGDGVRQLTNERGAVGWLGEPHFGIEPERGERLVGPRRPVDERACLPHEPRGEREQPARGQPIRRPCRIGRDRGERGRRDHVGRGGSPHDPLGHVALAALLDQLHQTVLLKGLDVVVDLLPGKPKPRRECGRGVWLGQLREHPSPDRIERDLRGCGILDHCDILHAGNLSPTILVVKAVEAVWRTFLFRARRGHVRQLPRAPASTTAASCDLAPAWSPGPRRAPRSCPRIRRSEDGLAEGQPGYASVHRACEEVPVVVGPGDETAPREQGRSHLRASHADREQVVGTLKAAYVHGLVTKDEFDARVSQTFASRTYAELALITADIPAGLAAAPPPPRPGRARRNSPAVASITIGRPRGDCNRPRSRSWHWQPLSSSSNPLAGIAATRGVGQRIRCPWSCSEPRSSAHGERQALRRSAASAASNSQRSGSRPPGGVCCAMPTAPAYS